MEPAGAVEIVELFETGDMGRADENLRHGHASIRAFNHPASFLVVPGHVDLGEGHALPDQERLGGAAIGAIAGGVDFDTGHFNYNVLERFHIDWKQKPL